MIKIENLVHKYTIWKDENTKSEKTVLDGISLDIPSGQFVAILGPNGSGKSTLAKHLNVLLLPNEGTVWIDGKDTHAKERLWEIRSQVGMVFQNPDNQIIGTSVEEDVAFGPENKNIEPEKIRKIVETVLRKVKLWDRRKALPSRLSGGQKQRLATADALAGLPACLVLDEPTAMLDPDSRKEVINIVKELNRKEGMTIILITHHTDEVVDADRIVLMKDGKIIGDDIPKKIFADYELLKKAKMDIDFDENKMTVIGKGNKERVIYLNKSCINAINDYLASRPAPSLIKRDSKNSDKALFLSEQKKRISNRTVQLIITKELEAAGLDTKKLSVHKLRHTAATLMYQYGNVDIRALQELLGHESIATTEIYTHVSNEQVRDAIERNPLNQ